MSQTIANPFAAHPRRRPTRLLAGIKGLVMVAGLFAFLIVAQAQSRRWLLERWVTGISELPVAEQVQRILQIDALGDIATETVASRLAAVDDTVAATVYELLRDHLNEWSSRDESALGRAHKNMIAGLEGIAPELSGQRARWAKELLNQSLVECVDRKVRETDEAFQAANRTLAILTPLATPEIESKVVANSTQRSSTALQVSPVSTERPRLMPLPVRMQTVEALSATNIASISPSSVPVAATADVMTVSLDPNVISKPSVPTITADAIRDSIQPVRHLTNSSLETFDTKSVIGMLGSQQADMRDQAVSELVRRGLSNEEIRVANQLASPLVDVRLGLLESIINRTDIDPRPWLLWLAEDKNREVRMQAISTLGTMNDAAIKQSLRQRLPHEHDPTVIAHIRRVVGIK